MNKHYIVAHYTPSDGEIHIDSVLAETELQAVNAVFKTEYATWDILWEALDSAEMALKIIECPDRRNWRNFSTITGFKPNL